MAHIYVVVFEEDNQPTKSDVADTIALFVNSGQIPSPQRGSRFAYLSNGPCREVAWMEGFWSQSQKRF